MPTTALHSPSLTRRIILLVLEVLIVTGGFFAYVHFQRAAHVPAYQEQDPDGYFWMAKRMAACGPLTMAEANPFQWQTHVWVEPTPGHIVPKYPPGYPILLACFMTCFGEDSAFYASTAMGALTVLGAYWLFRQWLGITLGIAASVTLILSPMFLGYSAYPLTHGLDICLVTWALAFLWHGMRRPAWGQAGSNQSQIPSFLLEPGCPPWPAEASKRRRHPGLTPAFVVAALLLGLAVTVRPTNLVLAALLPIAAWRSGMGRRGWLGMGLAYLPGPYIFGAYNWLVFGSPFRSGYDLSGEQIAFSWPAVMDHFPSFIAGLNQEALPIIFPLGLLGLLVWGSPRERLIRTLVFLPLLLVYCSYYWPYCGMASLRFLLIAFPVLVGSAFGLVKATPLNHTLTKNLLGVALCIFTLSLTHKRALSVGRTIRGYDGGIILAQAMHECDTHLTNNAVIFGVHPVFCHLGVHRNYDLYDLESFKPNHIVRTSDPREPRMQPSRREKLAQLYEASSEADLTHAMEDIIRHAQSAGRQTVFIMPKDWFRGYRKHFDSEFDFDEIDTWQENVQARDGTPTGRRWGMYQVSKLN